MPVLVAVHASPLQLAPQFTAAPKIGTTPFSNRFTVSSSSNSTAISGGSVVSAAVGDSPSSAYSSSQTNQESGAGMSSELSQSQAEMRDLINLQIAMQRENQYFTAISNILKTRHETLKTIIGNIR
jgi:hypothetical protein